MASLENRVVNTTTKTNDRSVRRSRSALRGLGALALLAPFISAPTPGNIGGCGGNLASTPVTPHEGNTGVTLESTYFEQGLCAGFCQRLYECGFLCTALTVEGLNCENQADAAKAFYLCVHEPVLRPEFFSPPPDAAGNRVTVNRCPHQCPGGTSFAYSGAGSAFVYQWDVQVCADAVMSRACSVDPTDTRSVLSSFWSAPSECANTNVCRPQ